MSEKDPIREGFGCLLQALALAVVILAYFYGVSLFK